MRAHGRRPFSGSSFEIAALALTAAIPALVGGVVLARQGWVPILDNATVAIRTFDLISTSPPLVGQPSTADSVARAFSPGPLQYWLLVGPLRLAGATTPVWVGALNGAMWAWAAVICRKLGGPALAWSATAGLVLLARCLGVEVLADVWNPWMGIAPLVLLVATAWACLLGHHRYLPLAVIAGSVAAQGHLTFGAPVTVLLVVSLLGVWLSAAQPDTSAGGDGAKHAAGRGWRPRDWTRASSTMAALLVALVCWAAPLYQQLRGSPGNLTVLWRAAGRSEAGGAGAAVDALAQAVGAPPAWLVSRAGRGIGSTPVDAGVVDLTALVVMAVAVVVAGLWSARVGDRAVTAASVVTGALAIGAGITASGLPVDRLDSWGYSTRWFPLIGLIAALTVGAAAVRRPRFAWRLRDGALPFGSTRVRRAIVGVGLVVAVSTSMWAADRNPDRRLYPSARDTAQDLTDHTNRGDRYRLAYADPVGVAATSTVLWPLRRAGRHVVLDEKVAVLLGDRYELEGARCDGILLVGSLPEADQNREGLISDVRYYDDEDGPTDVRIALLNDPDPDGSC